MKNRFRMVVPFMLASLVLLEAQSAHKTGSQRAPRPNIGETIQHLEGELRIATMKGDAGWFDQYLAENYAEVDADGRVRGRADVIQFYRTSQPEYDSWNLSEGSARSYNGDVVILTGRLDVQGTIQGAPMKGPFRFTHVWIRNGPQWQLAMQQATRIAG
jgi:ketosteroid isomerase-like protein